MQAFWDLSTTRLNAFDVGHIRWDVAMNYADRHGLDEEMANVLWDVIQTMDHAYREFYQVKPRPHKQPTRS